MPIHEINKKWLLLSVIIFLAFLIRIYNLTAHDMIIDDSLNSFRSIGYFDFLAAENSQSTPVTWFEEFQWWQILSFHDHPPINFITQFIFFKIIGVTVLAARLPFVLAGVGSVAMLYFIAQKLFNSKVGLYSAAILAGLNYHVWISRVGYIESLLIFFILLTLWLFLKAQENEKYYIAWGIAFGVGMATKYTFLFIGPIFLLYLLLFNKKDFQKPLLYFSLIPIIIILLPVGIYNFMLFKARGHFDAALSSILGFSPEDYSALTRQRGQGEIGGALKSLKSNLSLPALIIFVSSLFVVALDLIKNRQLKKYFLLFSYLIFAAVLFILADSHARFVTVLTPILALMGGLFFDLITKNKKLILQRLTTLLFIIFLSFEGFFSLNSQANPTPIGLEKITYASFRPIYKGYKQLDDYLFEKLPPAQPENLVVFYDAPQVIEYQKKIFSKTPSNKNDDQILIIYDGRIDWFAAMWLFERRKLYDLQSIGTVNNFSQALATNGGKYFTNLGFDRALFIFADDSNVTLESEEVRQSINALRQGFIEAGKIPEIIFSPSGQKSFEIFNIKLL